MPSNKGLIILSVSRFFPRISLSLSLGGLCGFLDNTRSTWRVTSGLHTAAQIGVGASVGSLVGVTWQHHCATQLNAKLMGFLSRFPNDQVPFSYVAGVMIVGAMTVGSVERKIAKLINKFRSEKKRG